MATVYLPGLDGLLYPISVTAGGGQLIIGTPVSTGTPTAGGQPVITISGRDLVRRALKKLGVLASGEVMDADMAQDGLDDLSGMLDSWSADGLMVPGSLPESFQLQAGKQNYSVGAGGDFDTARPSVIQFATVTLSGQELVMDGPVSTTKWGETVRTGTGFPTTFWYSGTAPFGELRFDTIPDQAYTVTLYTNGQLSRLDSLDTSVSLAPAYEEAIVYNLALRMASEYPAHKDLTLIAGLASDAITRIKRLNLQTIEIAMPSGGRYNIYTDQTH